MFLRRNARIDILREVKDSLVPVMWLEEYGEGGASERHFHIIRTSLSLLQNRPLDGL